MSMILSPSMNFATTIAPPPSTLADIPTKKYRKTAISAPSRKIRLSPSRTVSLSVVNPAAKARPPTLPLYFIYDRSQYARLATKSAHGIVSRDDSCQKRERMLSRCREYTVRFDGGAQMVSLVRPHGRDGACASPYRRA